MAFHLLRVIRIFVSSSKSPSSNFFTMNTMPLAESRREYSPLRDSGHVFYDIRRHLRQIDEETQNRVTETEQQNRVAETEQRKEEFPKEDKPRRVGRLKKHLTEKKPSRGARLSGTRRKISSCLSRNAVKNHHPDYKCSVTHAMDVLNGLSRLKKWSPLYRASMDHLMADVTHRQAFLAFSDPEDRIRYLRHKINKERENS